MPRRAEIRPPKFFFRFPEKMFCISTQHKINSPSFFRSLELEHSICRARARARALSLRSSTTRTAVICICGRTHSVLAEKMATPLVAPCMRRMLSFNWNFEDYLSSAVLFTNEVEKEHMNQNAPQQAILTQEKNTRKQKRSIR